jgi:DNA-binding transcriptional LysR family regulator
MLADNLMQRLPRRLKMGELRVFAAVVEHGSFRKAASILHLTQPAVTKAVSGLEEMLGVKLFDRNTHGVELTVHGVSLAPRVVAIFDELRRAAQDLARVANGEDGTLRLGTVPMPAIPFLPVAIDRLARNHPNIFVTIAEAREAELLDRLRKRDIELAIMRLALLDPGPDLRAEALFEEGLCVIGSKDHPLAQRKSLRWPELLRERWVLPPADCGFYMYLRDTLAAAGLQMPTHKFEAISIQLQFNLALHAGVVGFGMRSQISFAPGKEFLVRLPFDIPAPATAVAAVSLASHAQSPLAQQLVSHIRAMAASQ